MTRVNDIRRYLEGDTLDEACTGYIDEQGYLAHDGDACPVHEQGLDIGDGDPGEPEDVYCRACGCVIAADAEGDFCGACESEFAGRPRGIAQYLAQLMNGMYLDGAGFKTDGRIEADEPLPLSGTTQYEGCLVAFQIESNDGRRFRVMVEEITLDADRQ